MKITKDKIKRELVDITGKYRVWIEMENGDWQMLKFQEKPTITKIQVEIDKTIKLEENGTSNSRPT